MLVTYIRSSSANTFDVCPQKYYLTYCLGLQEPPSEKASYGNVLHKGFENASRRQIAIQNGLDVVDCEELGTYSIEEMTDEFALRLGFEHYKSLEMPHWDESKFEEALKDFHNALGFMGGVYDPRNMNIVEVEKRFDITIEDDWGRYDYTLPDGTNLFGQLTLRGTIDCVYRDHSNSLSCLDYKSGMNTKDLKTNLEKDYDYFLGDFQINLYVYALLKAFPDEPFITFIIWYFRKLGPFTMCFDRDQLPEIEAMVRDKFIDIKKTTVPKLRPHSWFCTYVCGHYKSRVGNKSTCQHFKDEIRLKGIDLVTQENIDLNKLTTYTGGGRQAK